ncbi:hypothetical protein ABZP36_018419 [Zizania latifolia]
MVATEVKEVDVARWDVEEERKEGMRRTGSGLVEYRALPGTGVPAGQRIHPAACATTAASGRSHRCSSLPSPSTTRPSGTNSLQSASFPSLPPLSIARSNCCRC